LYITMSPKLNGTYKMVSCSNKEVYMRALYPTASDEVIKVLASPANEITVESTETDSCWSGTIKNSAKPDSDASMNVPYGVETVLPAELGGYSLHITRNGNTILNKATLNGAVFCTTTTNVSANGFLDTLQMNGIVVTNYYEKQEIPIAGIYVMESNTGLAQCMESEFGMSPAAANVAASFHAVRFTEQNGVWTHQDFFGDGSSANAMSFRMGEEFEQEIEIGGGGVATHLFTNPAPGKLTYMMKKPNGKVQTWNAEFTADSWTWTCDSPACTIKSRRIPDSIGSWKMVSCANHDALLTALGVPAAQIADIVAEKPVHTVEFLGNGRWKYSTDSKAMKMEPNIFRDGEETSFEFFGQIVHEVTSFTKDGMVGVFKMDGNTLNYTTKVGKQFMIMNQEVEGKPGSRSVFIFTKQ